MGNTRQKDAIRSILEAAERPLSHQEVLELASQTVSGIGIATVYRNIKKLVEEGYLKLVEIPGSPSRFELADLDHHHHFQCQVCDKLFDIQGCPGNLSKLAPPGFETVSHDITLYGSCSECNP